MEIRLAQWKDQEQILQYGRHIHPDRVGAFLPPEQDAGELVYLKML